MAHIEKRGEQRYRVRYRDPTGRERSKTFTRRRDAQRFRAVVEDELARGTWIDPDEQGVVGCGVSVCPLNYEIR